MTNGEIAGSLVRRPSFALWISRVITGVLVREGTDGPASG